MLLILPYDVINLLVDYLLGAQNKHIEVFFFLWLDQIEDVLNLFDSSFCFLSWLKHLLLGISDAFEVIFELFQPILNVSNQELNVHL